MSAGLLNLVGFAWTKNWSKKKRELKQTQQLHSITDMEWGRRRLSTGRAQRQSNCANLIVGAVCSHLQRPSRQSTLTMLTPIHKALIIKWLVLMSQRYRKTALESLSTAGPSIKKQNENTQTTQGFRFSIGRIIRITGKNKNNTFF